MPQATYTVTSPETVSMATRDGVRLDADLYRPTPRNEGETFPVLLMRQPYGRAIASTVVFAHPAWYAARGYIVVIQDVQGRGTSQGKFRLFENDVADGADAVRWAAGLPGASGKVGMYGFSYQGVTQLLAAAGLMAEHDSARPLAALAPAMIGYRIHDDWVYEGGAFYLAPNIGWGLQMAAEEARIAGDEEAYLALRNGMAGMPLGESVSARPALLMRHPQYGHYNDWVSEPAPGDYWKRISPAGRLTGLDVPVLHVGGWYDLMLPGTMAAYRELQAEATAAQSLTIGPWTHMNWTGLHPADNSQGNGETDIDAALIAWFDRWLKDEDPAEEFPPPVRLFELGRNQWRYFPEFPDPEPAPLYLTGDGRAALVSGSGQLAGHPAAQRTEDRIVLDPWRPTPTTGGHADHPGGRVDRTETDARSDVATFTGQPLEQRVSFAGTPRVELHCTGLQASFDLSVVLSEVDPSGRAVNLTEGYLRIAPGVSTSPVCMDLRPVAASIAPGYALRLSIALASFPAHSLNAGDGSPDREARIMDTPITTIALSHGGDTPSRLLLPVLSD